MGGLRAPDGGQQGAMRQDLAGIAREVDEEIEFLGREVDWLAVNGDDVGGCVDHEVAGFNGGGGAWADPFSYAHLDGSQANGIRGFPGTCVINCTTNNEIYSFHPGGANLLFADGSVHFIKESINPFTMVGLVTRAMGEILSSDSY